MNVETRLTSSSWFGFKSLAAVLLVGLTSLIAGCGGGGGGAAAPATPTLQSISVSAAETTLVAGMTDQFTATGMYSDGSKQALSSVTWSSTSASVASISSGGLATGVAAGSTTITATSGGVSGQLALTVTAATLVSIGVTPATTLAMVQDQTEQFTATGVYSDSTKQNLTSKVTWSSGTTTVATVSAAGVVTAVGAGSSAIKATMGTVSGTATVTVTAPVLESITVFPATPSIAKGQTQTFAATGNYSNNLKQNLTSSVTWSSGTPTVATITSAGLATAVAPGTSKISATLGSISGSTTMTVTPAVIVSIAVTPANPSIAKGTTQPFTATGTYSDGTMLTITTTAFWSSNNTSFATVSNSPGFEGIANGVGQGTATIKATLGNVSGSTGLTVNPATLVSIAVTPANGNVIVNGTVQYTATGTYTDNSTQNVTIASTWASNNTGVATISNAGGSNGLATGVSGGTSGITATIGLVVSPIVTLTVKPTEYAYVANYSSGTVSQFSIDPTTGALIALTPTSVAAGTNPFAIGIGVGTTQNYAYVLNFGGGNLSAYTIASGAGTLTTPATTVGTGNGPNGIAVTATNVYVANYTDGTISQFGFNATTGALTALIPATVTAGGGAAEISVNPAGTYAVVANYTAATVMSFSIGAGGALSTLPVSTVSLGAGHQPDSVAFDPTGSYVYVGDQFNNDVAQFSLSGGGVLAALTPATVATGGNPYSVDLVSTVGGNFLYAVNAANSTVQQLTEGLNGQMSVTSTTSVGAGTTPNYMAVDPSGQFAYVTDRGTGPGFGSTVSQYSITPVGGTTPGSLTALSPATATTGTQPTGVVTTTAP